MSFGIPAPDFPHLSTPGLWKEPTVGEVIGIDAGLVAEWGWRPDSKFIAPKSNGLLAFFPKQCGNTEGSYGEC